MKECHGNGIMRDAGRRTCAAGHRYGANKEHFYMEISLFGTLSGREVRRYTLCGEGIELSVLDYGAAVQSLVVDGVETVMNFDTPEDYRDRGGYVCLAVGRVANRIAGAEFSIGDKKYSLAKNEGENQLHGGFFGFSNRFYDAEEHDGTLRLSAILPDGEDGYPGNMRLNIDFSVSGRSVMIKYTATSDKDTVFAPTHHFYFNLNGAAGRAGTQPLAIYSDGYIPVDGELIPLGFVAPVAGGEYDFRAARTPKRGGGGIYDCCFVLRDAHAATLTGNKSGIKLDIYTDMPGLQLYTGAALSEKSEGETGNGAENETENGAPHRSGIALEPQYIPNAVNMPDFETPLLPAGETAEHYIKLSFSHDCK